MIFLCVGLNLWAFSSGCGVQWFEIAKCAPLNTGLYADRLLSRRSPFCTSVCLAVRIYQPQKQSLRWIKVVQFAWDCCRIHFMSILHRFRGSRSIMWILLSSQHYVSAHKLRIKGQFLHNLTTSYSC